MMVKHVFKLYFWIGAADFEKDYPELKNYCEKISSQIPNYAKACGDGATTFGTLGGENFKKAVEKVKAWNIAKHGNDYKSKYNS